MTSLTELGLSSYEEQAYRTLLATGPAPARTVADRSGVPAGRIYDVLDGLASRGLVQSQTGDPRLYEPCGPAAAAETLLADRLADLEAEADRYRDLAADARETLTPTPPTDGNVWLSAFDDADAVTLIGEILSAATDRFVMAVGTPYVGASVDEYRQELDAFVEQMPTDVTVEVLLDEALIDAYAEVFGTVSDRDADLSVRTRPDIQLTVEVVDGTSAYVDVPHPFVDGRRVGFVEIRDRDVAAEIERLFDEAWAEADPV